MDYIQKDLELIRMASSNDSESSTGKAKQRPKKDKPVKKQKQQKDKDGSKSQSKPPRHKAKTLSPAKLQKELKKMERKEKAASRRSIGNVKNSPSLGKIKLPSVKKHVTAVQKETPVGTKRKLLTEPKEARSPAPLPKPEPVPKITTTPASSARSKKSLDPDAVPLEAIRFEEGAKIEAVDHGQWYKGKIVKVDQEKMDILVHFEGWGARFDTWFPMTSTLIRGRTQLNVKPEQPTYEDGEDVLARWTDGNFYPATILSVKGSGSCMVMYFDGMKKLLRPNMMKKMSEKEKETAMKAAEKMLLLPPAVGSPQSSVSAGSPSSADGASFRKYKTSANDREKRIAARSERGQDTKSTAARKKAVKRKASERETATSEMTPVGSGILPAEVASGRSSRRSSEDENFNAKKARLDRITDSLLDRVSPDSDSSSKKDAAQVKDIGASPKLAAAQDEVGSDSDSPLVIDEESEGQPPKKRKLKKKPKAVDAGTKVKRPYSPQVQSHKDGSREGSGDRAGSAPPTLSEEKQSGSPLPVSNVREAGKTAESIASMKPKTEAGNIPDSGALKGETNATPETNVSEDQAKNGEAPMKTENQSEVLSTSTQISEQGGTLPDRGLLELLPKTQPIYKKGDIVLAKWADCRSYLAYVLKKEDDENYKIRYYDGMIKTVKSSFIHPWVGPLPDALKSFKPKSPPKRKGRRASDSKQVQRKRTKDAPTSPKIKGTPRERTSSAPEQAKISRRRSRTSSEGMPLDIIQYHHGEKVLAKWTDLKWYPATVVGQTDPDHYKVRYHDDLTRIVRDTWLTPWKPPAPTGQSQAGVSQATPGMASQDVSDKTEEIGVEKPTLSGETDKMDGSTKENQPEEGSIIEAGEVVGLGEKSIKTYEKFNVDDAVLARWTDCRNYPATIRKVLDDGRYVVEYYDGMQRELKPAMLKSWNPSAMPPTMKPRKPRNAASTAVASDVTAGKLRATKLTRQVKKPGRLQATQAQAGNMPRQVVRGYDAYYARLPAAAKDAMDSDHHKFKCRVPGCTKSFRKEDLLRQHHKYYHQQRYKLRDMETNAAPRRRASKEDTRDLPRRRVSADYEAITKGLDTTSHPLVTMLDMGIVAQQGRGAKPPIDVYKKQHAHVSISSVSSVLDSSSGVDDLKSHEGKVDKKGKPVGEQSTVAGKASQATAVEPKLTRRKRKRQSAEVGEEVKGEADAVAKLDAPEEENSETVNEDVIRCTCGVEEEEGFMIQCEGCFTWQHGACVGVDQPKDATQTAKTSNEKIGEVMDIDGQETKSSANNETKVEEKKTTRSRSDSDNNYICWVCMNPQNVRQSKRYLYNNEFLTKGKLPSLSNLEGSEPLHRVDSNKTFEVMMLAMHQLMDDVVKMQDTLHGIKQKIKVVASPGEHPLLKTWKDPDSTAVGPISGNTEVQESAPSQVTEENTVENAAQEKADDVKKAEALQEGPLLEKPKINLDVAEPASGNGDNQSVQGGGTAGTAPHVDKTPESKLAPSTEDNAATSSDKTVKKPKKKVPGRRGRSSSSEMSVTEREMYIDRCRENLLDHILELEKQLDDRLTKLEDFVSRIDSQEVEGNEESGDIGKLQDDLTAVQKLLLYC